MSTAPLVSILIPCCNAERWLRVCVESALAQTHPEIEVIVHDDGSTDGSLQTLDGLSDPRLRLTNGPGEGGNIARNRLLAAATGEWVQFLDADDRLEPEKISRQLAEAGPSVASADVLYSPVIVETWRDNRVVGREPTVIDAQSDLFTRWLTWQLPQTGGALWRREALLRIGGWKEDQPCCQEHELYLRALLAGLRFHHCPTPGAIYRVWSEDTVSRRDPLQVIHEKTRLIDSLADHLRAQGKLLPAHRAAAGQACFEMARTWAARDLDAAAAYFNHRRRLGLVQAAGPAAPRLYRLTLGALGFRNAEKIARARRRP